MGDQIPRFGATDFYFLDADPAAVRDELRRALASYLGYTPGDADPYFVACMALMPYIVQTRALADSAAKASLLSYAVGQDLDRIADATCAVGYLDRLPARRAFFVSGMNFYSFLPPATETSPDSFPYTWELSFEYAGRVYAGSGDGLVTKELYEPTSGELPYWRYVGDTPRFFAFCDTPGAVGNLSVGDVDSLGIRVLATAGMSVIFDGQAVDLSAHTPVFLGAAGGADAEDDASFADRIRLRREALKIPGSAAYYMDLVKPLYGLRDVYVPRSAFRKASSTSEEDAIFDGCVQLFYVGDAPAGGLAFDAPDPDTGERLSERIKRAIEGQKLVSDRVLIGEASQRELLQRVSVHYSVFSGASADTLTRIQAVYYEMLEKYCYRIGITINFDEIAGALVAAGAFDASVKYGTSALNNLDLYSNEYLGASQVELIRDADTAPVETVSPYFKPSSDAELII